ncbi:MAG: YitT family protein [Lachnospiraceae bacterium]|nr:YitT family protein [Lachnospiraceae bacterium]
MQWKRRIIDGVTVLTATIFYSVAISLFLDPNDLAPGGVTGISVIINRISGIETGTLILLLNIPILLLGLWKFGKRFIASTGCCILLTSFFTNLLAYAEPLTKEPLLAVLAGGGLMGIALGLVFRVGSTTGGTDIIVKILRIKLPHLRTGAIFMLIDLAVVACSAFVFQDIDKALYAGIAVFFASFCMDLVLYGQDGAKLLYIISDAPQQIAQRILQELDIGVTYIQGSGAYSGRGKKVLMCVMRKQLYPRVREVVKEEDPQAFMIVTSATEIYGQGYKNYFNV